MDEGYIIELDKLAGEPLDLYVNAKLIARGEAVMIGDHHTDLYSGRDAGTATCFCAYGLGNPGTANPDYTVQSAAELLCLFPGSTS